MSGADQNFVQVMATILVGTFIAYSVDMRSKKRPDLSRFSAMQRYGYWTVAGVVDVIPLLAAAGLVSISYSVTYDHVTSYVKGFCFVVSVMSVVALGVGAFLDRYLSMSKAPL